MWDIEFYTEITFLELFKEQLKSDFMKSGNKVDYKMFMRNKVLYIIFQGSVDNEDWKQNFRFWRTPYKDMKIKWYAHKGFVYNWKSVKEEVISNIKFFMDNNVIEKIVVSGYSHGAGIATLAYECIKFVFDSINILIFGVVFGSPRVIFSPFQNIQDRFNTFVRIENPGDIVSHAPPVLFGYQHVGQLMETGPKIFNHLTKKHHVVESYLKSLESGSINKIVKE